MEESAIFWMVVSVIITLIYVPIIYKQNQYNNKLIEENEELKSEVESLQKKLKSEEKVYNELEIMTGKLEKKYDFMRKNTRKYNVGDFVKSIEIVEVDVKMPTIIDHIKDGAINIFGLFFNKKPVPFKKPEFIYKVKQSESWFTETELENHSTSFPISKRKYKKRTPKTAK